MSSIPVPAPAEGNHVIDASGWKELEKLPKRM